MSSASTQTVTSKPISVISCDEVQRYHELGLGRGINVTDPQMWCNKKSFQVRQISDNLDNVIATEESGVLTSYEKEVSTFSEHQQKLRMGVSDSISSLKIGLDEHFSMSSSSTKLLKGQKIEKRTISFKFHPDEIPTYTSVQNATMDFPHHFLFDGEIAFEHRLYDWILKCMADRDAKSTAKLSSAAESEALNSGATLSAKLTKLLTDDQQELHLKILNEDCLNFVNNLGLTHYVSSIKLGACHYQETTTKSKQKQLGVGASVGVGSSTKGSISGMIAQQWRLKTIKQQKIGRINVTNEIVEREAVIDFHVEPLHRLVRIQLIQILLQKAIRDYIHKKAECIEGPFFILCEMSDPRPQETINGLAADVPKPVYWCVNKNYELWGTESVENATPFYILPASDHSYPSEFHITIWSKTKEPRDTALSLNDMFRDSSDRDNCGPCLPRYLTTDCNFFQSDEPLKFSTAVKTENAIFSLYSRFQHSFSFLACRSTPVGFKEWIEGEKFFINSSHHSLFQLDRFIAMSKINDEDSQIPSGNPYQYKAMMPKTISKDCFHMLFRLQSVNIKQSADTEDDDDSSSCG